MIYPTINYAIFDKKGDIWRLGTKRSEIGGTSGGRTRTAQDVPVHLSPLSAYDRIRYQQADFPVTHLVMMPTGTDVKGGDQLWIGERRFDLKQPGSPEEMNSHLEMPAEEIVPAKTGGK